MDCYFREGGPHETQLWVDKYKPINCKSIIGQQGEITNSISSLMNNEIKQHSLKMY